jgi:TatD DNase family protein
MSSKRTPSGPVPAPEPLPGPVVDNHTHLDHRRGAETGSGASGDNEVGALIAAARAVNVTRLVQIGCDLDAARWTARAVGIHPDIIGGVALHPTEATKHAARGELQDALAEIEALADGPRIRVVGETGLDHYWVEDETGRAAQEESFRWHIDLAKRSGKVLQIHDRDAHGDVLRILEEEGAPEKTVFHCFSGDAAMARYCAERGWYLSFAGTLTFKNANSLREALLSVPFDRVLVETDAPYLTPEPNRGRANASYLMPHTVRRIASVTEREIGSICSDLFINSEQVYGPW